VYVRVWIVVVWCRVSGRMRGGVCDPGALTVPGPPRVESAQGGDSRKQASKEKEREKQQWE
jgi:hypothetical protein